MNDVFLFRRHIGLTVFFFGALLYGIFLGLFSHYLYCVHSKTNSSFANQHTQSYDPQGVGNAHIFRWTPYEVYTT